LSFTGYKVKETSKLGPRPEKPIEIYEFEGYITFQIVFFSLHNIVGRRNLGGEFPCSLFSCSSFHLWLFYMQLWWINTEWLYPFSPPNMDSDALPANFSCPFCRKVMSFKNTVLQVILNWPWVCLIWFVPGLYGWWTLIHYICC
jgi:hypothetical protein